MSLYALVDGVGIQLGAGRWDCCNALSKTAEPCAVQWSCCQRWQLNSSRDDAVGCGIVVCKGCNGDWDEQPTPESNELKCANCGQYVERVPAGMEPPELEGCRELGEDEDHNVFDRVVNTRSDHPADIISLRLMTMGGIKVKLERNQKSFLIVCCTRSR